MFFPRCNLSKKVAKTHSFAPIVHFEGQTALKSRLPSLFDLKLPLANYFQSEENCLFSAPSNFAFLFRVKKSGENQFDSPNFGESYVKRQVLKIEFKAFELLGNWISEGKRRKTSVTKLICSPTDRLVKAQLRV